MKLTFTAEIETDEKPTKQQWEHMMNQLGLFCARIAHGTAYAFMYIDDKPITPTDIEEMNDHTN